MSEESVGGSGPSDEDASDADLRRVRMTWWSSPPLRAAARHAAYHPVVNRTARGLLGPLKAVSPRAARTFDDLLPVAGVQTVAMADGSTFRLKVDETSHASTIAVCRKGLSAVEPDVVPVFASLAAHSRAILDVGANIGVYTIAAAVLNPKAEVIAFEPIPSAFDRLQTNVVLNGLVNVVCVNAAVGDSVSEVTLFAPIGRIPTTASQEVSHRLRHPYQREKEPGPYACHVLPSIDLDHFVELAKVSSVDLVKIDVELAELSVLQGMSRILATDQPHIICELFPESWINRDVGSELEAILSPHNYQFYVLTDEGLRHCRHITGDPEHPNQLFTQLGPDALAAAVERPVTT
jgi:FkbM family methyltransferase